MANETVFGRSHNPFTGVPEIFIHPDGNPLAEKIREELAKSPTPIEIESDGTKLSTRPLRRTIEAAVHIAIMDLDAGKLKARDVLSQIPQDQFIKILHTQTADVTGLTELGTGIGVANGVASGLVVTSSKEAVAKATRGTKVILVVDQTTPEDMQALELATAIVNTTGGYTSHSAVIARQLGKACIVSYKGKAPSGMITIDGSNGKLYEGEAKYTESALSDDAKRVIGILDDVARLKVFANADTSEHVKVASENRAHGIGLCRTEHTFFTEVGLRTIRRLILAKTAAEKSKALLQFEEAQKTHFVNVFTTLGSNPATVRLLDPPLHEFLPNVRDKEAISELALELKQKISDIKARISELHETNPMLGHRGCRLNLTFENLAEVQTRAIVSAARQVMNETAGKGPSEIGIMVPLIVAKAEMVKLTTEIKSGIESAKQLIKVPDTYKQEITIGAMLETPRACLIAKELAEVCDFFSFGTNDLTQTVWALSRDDGARFMASYVQNGLVQTDPFESLDITGVGLIMAHAIESLGDLRKKVKIGICGEHGGDPASIDFCNRLGLDYISCSPPRLLRAKIAAAYAALEETKQEAAIKETFLDPPIMVTAGKKQMFEKGKVLKSLNNFTPATFVTTEELATSVGLNPIACDNDLFIEYDAQDHVAKELTVGRLIGYTDHHVLVHCKAGNLGSKMLTQVKEVSFLNNKSIKDYEEEQLWFVPLEGVKYGKMPSKSQAIGAVNIPETPSKAVKGYDSNKKEWIVPKQPNDLAELIGWMVITNDGLTGQIIGESKVYQRLIVRKIGDNTVFNVEKANVLKIAPMGTKMPEPDKAEVDAKAVEVLDMEALGKLSYADLAKAILGKKANIKNPDKTISNDCEIVGFFPHQDQVKSFVVVKKDLKTKGDIKYINPLIKFIDGETPTKKLATVNFKDMDKVVK